MSPTPVAAALAEGRPVVALESTIITHGMPFPQNAEMAAAVERIIAEEKQHRNDRRHRRAAEGRPRFR